MSLNEPLLEKIHELEEKYPDHHFWSKEDVDILVNLSWRRSPNDKRTKSSVLMRRERYAQELYPQWKKGWTALKTQETMGLSANVVNDAFADLDSTYYDIDSICKYSPIKRDCERIVKRMIYNHRNKLPEYSGYRVLSLRKDFFFSIVDVVVENFGTGEELSRLSDLEISEVITKLRYLFK